MRFSWSTHLLLSLETLTSIIRTGLPTLVELIDLVNSVINFLSQMTLLWWLTFQTVIPALLDLFIFSDTSICSTTMAFPSLGNSDHVVVSVSIWKLKSRYLHKEIATPFHCIAYDYSHADWNGLCDHLEMFHKRISLKSVLLLLSVNFVSGFGLKLMYSQVA